MAAVVPETTSSSLQKNPCLQPQFSILDGTQKHDMMCYRSQSSSPDLHAFFLLPIATTTHECIEHVFCKAHPRVKETNMKYEI